MLGGRTFSNKSYFERFKRQKHFVGTTALSPEPLSQTLLQELEQTPRPPPPPCRRRWALIFPLPNTYTWGAGHVLTPATVWMDLRPFHSVAIPLAQHLHSSYRGGGGIFALGFFRTRKFRTEFVSHSGLKIPWEISHPSRIVLFTRGSCTAKF